MTFESKGSVKYTEICFMAGNVNPSAYIFDVVVFCCCSFHIWHNDCLWREDRTYDLVLKGQRQRYFKSPLLRACLSFFYLGFSYLEQWLLMLCR